MMPRISWIIATGDHPPYRQHSTHITLGDALEADHPQGAFLLKAETTYQKMQITKSGGESFE